MQLEEIEYSISYRRCLTTDLKCITRKQTIFPKFRYSIVVRGIKVLFLCAESKVARGNVEWGCWRDGVGHKMRGEWL